MWMAKTGTTASNAVYSSGEQLNFCIGTDLTMAKYHLYYISVIVMLLVKLSV